MKRKTRGEFPDEALKREVNAEMRLKLFRKEELHD